MKPMRLLSIVLMMLVLNANIFCQKSVNAIVDKFKESERYEGFEVPGYILRWTLRLSKIGGKDRQIDNIAHILKNVKSITYATTSYDQRKFNNKAILSNLIKMVTEKDKFEEYISYKEKKSTLSILIKESNDIVKNIVLLNADGRELSIIHIKAKISLEDFKNLDLKDINKSVKKVKIDSSDEE
jgi:hypothetical protein